MQHILLQLPNLVKFYFPIWSIFVSIFGHILLPYLNIYQHFVFLKNLPWDYDKYSHGKQIEPLFFKFSIH